MRSGMVGENQAGNRDKSTSFCEQKEAKKLYGFQSRAFKTPREAEQKFFWFFFFKKRTSFCYSNR
jgi:hypothetical protein